MRKIVWLAFVIAALAAASCVDTNARQCESQSDCASILGLPPDQTVCAADGICQPVRADSGIVTPPLGACRSNGACTEQNGGAPHVCIADQCVAILEGDLLTEVTDNYRHGDPIFVGFIAPVTDASGFRSRHTQAWIDTVKYAVEEWDNRSGGGLSVPASNVRRPIVAVFCDSKDDPTRAQECARAMTRRSIPAIVVRSFVDANAVLPLTLESKTLLYCSDCEPSTLDPVPTQGLRWVGTPPLRGQTDVRVEWGKRLEQKARTKHGLDPSDKIRVAYVSSAELSYTKDLGDALVFDGEIDWHEVAYLQVDWRDVATQILDLRPHIVVTAHIGYDFHMFLLPEIEARWGAGLRPEYFVSEDESFSEPLQYSIGTNSDLRRRITGAWSTASDQVEQNWAAFENAFLNSEKYGYQLGGNVLGFESFYVIAFGLTAALSQPMTTERPTGIDVANGIKRLMGGPPANIIDFRGDIGRGIELLRRGELIDARGVYSELEWDPQTGELISDAAIWCASLENGKTKPKEVWRYDARSKAVVGEPNFDVCTYE